MLFGQIAWLLVGGGISRGYLPDPMPWVDRHVRHSDVWLFGLLFVPILWGVPILTFLLLRSAEFRGLSPVRRGLVWLVELGMIFAWFLTILPSFQ